MSYRVQKLIYSYFTKGKPSRVLDQLGKCLSQKWYKAGLIRAKATLAMAENHVEILVSRDKIIECKGRNCPALKKYERKIKEAEKIDLENTEFFKKITEYSQGTNQLDIDDIRLKRPGKIIGFLPLNQVGHYKSVWEIMQEIENNGYTPKIIKDDYTWFFFTYNKTSLQKLLKKHKPILINTQLPLKADAFVSFIAQNWVTDQEAGRIIDMAFANPFKFPNGINSCF